MARRLWNRIMKFLGMHPGNARPGVMDERRDLRAQREDAQRLARLAQRENSHSLDRLYQLTLEDIGDKRNGQTG